MDWMLMPLKRYAEFSGRSRRMEYWMFIVFQFLIGIGFVVLMIAVGGGAVLAAAGDPTAGLAAGGALMIIVLLNWLVSLALFIPTLAVSIRRLHDTNRSGWWILFPLVPYILMIVGAAMESPALTMIFGLGFFVAVIAIIVFYFLDGTPGPNRYGEDPKGRGMADTFA